MMYLYTFLVSTVLVYGYQYFAIKIGMMDEPNHRTSHQAITPRGAGVVFVSLWLSIFLWLFISGSLSSVLFYSLFIPTLLVGLVSYLDDYLNLKRRYRLGTHILAAVIAVHYAGQAGLDLGQFKFAPSIFLACLYVFYVIWSINLYNFMDGLDGLAATQSIFILLVSGIFLLLSNDIELSKLNIVLAFSVMGFLVWNWPGAKVFMGDVGSTSLGLIIATVSILSQKSQLSILLYLILYMPFLFDATGTLVRRMLAGEKWYEPHNKHGFQRLFQAGWNHQQVLMGLIILDVLLLLFAIGAFYLPQYCYALFLLSFIVVAYAYYCIECINPMFVSKKRVA